MLDDGTSNQPDLAPNTAQQRVQAAEALRQARAFLGELSISLDDLAHLLGRPELQSVAGAMATGRDTGVSANGSILLPRTSDGKLGQVAAGPDQLQTSPDDAQTFAQALLDTLTDEIAVVDAAGTILYLNEPAAQKLGTPAAAARGLSLWNLYPPEQAAHRKMLLNQVVSSGEPLQFTARAGDRWHEISLRPLHDVDGLGSHVVIATRDITRRVDTEERLKLVIIQLLTIQEDERRRIAQDLHDDIGQGMTALMLNLTAIANQRAAGRGDSGDQVKEALRTAETMMKHIRQIFYELRPPSLASTSLPKVLESLCSSFALSTGVRVDFSSQAGIPPIPNVQATALYRLVQEGLHNAVKHAKASSVWVNLDHVDGEISVSMEDDGQGCDPALAVGRGMGLLGIRERFLMLEGSFDIEAAPGKGIRLYGSLPLTEHA